MHDTQAPLELTILLDLLIEVVDINGVVGVVGAGLGNCHGMRCRRSA